MLLTEGEGGLPMPPTQAISEPCYQAFGTTSWAGEKVVGDTEWEPILCAMARGFALRKKTRVFLVPSTWHKGWTPIYFSIHSHPLPLTLCTPGQNSSSFSLKYAILADLRDLEGSVPGHSNERNIALKQVKCMLCFPSVCKSYVHMIL